MAFVVLIIVSILVFLGMRFLPGDPIVMLLSETQLETYSEEQVAMLKHEYGLDKPIPIQYINWVGDIFRGNLGLSIKDHAPFLQLIVESA
jgi:peptide/nickel transport system permease protein